MKQFARANLHPFSACVQEDGAFTEAGSVGQSSSQPSCIEGVGCGGEGWRLWAEEIIAPQKKKEKKKITGGEEKLNLYYFQD